MQTAIKFQYLFKGFYEGLACRIILWIYQEVYKNKTKIIYGIILYLNIYGAHALQLHEESFHFLLFLNTFKFLADLGKLFQIFGPELSKLLVPKVTYLFLGIFKFSFQVWNLMLVPRFLSQSYDSNYLEFYISQCTVYVFF